VTRCGHSLCFNMYIGLNAVKYALFTSLQRDTALEHCPTAPSRTDLFVHRSQQTAMALSMSTRRALCQAAAIKPATPRRLSVVVKAEGAPINPAIKKGRC
jgi:hypothetical protein